MYYSMNKQNIENILFFILFIIVNLFERPWKKWSWKNENLVMECHGKVMAFWSTQPGGTLPVLQVCSVMAELGCLPSVCYLNLALSVLTVSLMYSFSHTSHCTPPHTDSLSGACQQGPKSVKRFVVWRDSLGYEHPLELFRYPRNVVDADRELPSSCPVLGGVLYLFPLLWDLKCHCI